MGWPFVVCRSRSFEPIGGADPVEFDRLEELPVELFSIRGAPLLLVTIYEVKGQVSIGIGSPQLLLEFWKLRLQCSAVHGLSVTDLLGMKSVQSCLGGAVLAGLACYGHGAWWDIGQHGWPGGLKEVCLVVPVSATLHFLLLLVNLCRDVLAGMQR